jgi:hypothetical protein
MPVQARGWEDMAAMPRGARFRRTASFSSWDALQSVATAGDVISQAGYPLEEHTVTTSDGYVLQMERLPRRGARARMPCLLRFLRAQCRAAACGRMASCSRCFSCTPASRCLDCTGRPHAGRMQGAYHMLLLLDSAVHLCMKSF